MSTTSLVRFMNQKNGGDRGQLHWGRADVDGAPFRGHAPLTMTEDEADTRLVRLLDMKVKTFDLDNPDDVKAYTDVLDKIANGWAMKYREDTLTKRIKRKRDDGSVEIDERIRIFFVWGEYYMEDGQPMQSQRPYLGRPNE
jgi:hypothetical protein